MKNSIITTLVVAGLSVTMNFVYVDGLLAADFGPSGLRHYDQGTWNRVSTGNADGLWIYGNKGVADFGSSGLYEYDEAWTRISAGNGEKDLRQSIEGSYLYGSINGFLQTPSGGTPGTTSNKRPTFKEFDLDNVGITDTSLNVSKGVHTLYAGTRLIRLQSLISLNNTLISQAKTYPAGSSVELDAKLDWHRFGYQHLFSYSYDKKATFGFYPGIELAIFDFHYKLNGPDNLSTDRRYMQGTLRFGGRAEWSPGDRFSLSAETLVSIPVPTFIFSLHVMGKYQLWGQADQGGALFLGVAYEIIDFEDSQEVPNHIRAEMGPMAQVTFQVNF